MHSALQTAKTHKIYAWITAFLLVLLAACSTLGNPSPGPGPTPGPEPQPEPPADVSALVIEAVNSPI